MKPTLSIIIPTKNRYVYLESCLRSLHAKYDKPEVEIIITDNSMPKVDISGVLGLFSNIKYSYIDAPISQVENFESALEKVTGDYVTMIGDDDSLSGLLLEVVDYMRKNSIDALNSPFVTYFWPDVVSKNKTNDFSGKMFLPAYDYRISKIEAGSEVRKCLDMGGTSLCNMPRMYYGIIKKDILDKVKETAGVYFPGPSPDMANALSAALFTNSFVDFGAPLFIAGNSAKSAAGMGLAGKHVGAIEGNPQLPKDCHLKWTELIPKYWSGPTIWAESAMQVLKQCKRPELEEKFNYMRMYASCMIFHPEYQEEIEQAMKSYPNQNKIFTTISLNLQKLSVWSLRFRYLIKNMTKKAKIASVTEHQEVKDVEQAAVILDAYNDRIKMMLK